LSNKDNEYQKVTMWGDLLCKISGHNILDWKISYVITIIYVDPDYRHFVVMLNIILEVKADWTQ
jgi:hypothetical protein